MDCGCHQYDKMDLLFTYFRYCFLILFGLLWATVHQNGHGQTEPQRSFKKWFTKLQEINSNYMYMVVTYMYWKGLEIKRESSFPSVVLSLICFLESLQDIKKLHLIPWILCCPTWIFPLSLMFYLYSSVEFLHLSFSPSLNLWNTFFS